MRQYKVLLILIQVILSMESAVAGFERIAQPTTVFAGAYSGVASFTSDNLWLNPASIGRQSALQTSLFYSPSPFQLKQLSNYGAIVAGAFEGFRLAGGVQSAGFDLYKETSGTLCVSFDVTGSFSAGVSLQLYHLSIERYGTALRPAFDAGFIVQLNDLVTFGSVLRNISRTGFGNDDDIPQELCSGITIQAESWGRLSVDITKDIRYPLGYSAGIEVKPYEPVSLHIGINGSNSILTAGIKIELSEISIQYGVVSHQMLGLSHSFGVTFQ